MDTRKLTNIDKRAAAKEATEVAMSKQHDRLAQVLQDISERFPDDGFTKHGRLRGLLADHLPDSEREIRVALDAIDEGVIDMYRDTASQELGMRVDRLVMRLENSRGIREDIGRPVVLAYGYALGLGELPSKSMPVPTAAVATEVNNTDDDWIGATVLAGAPGTSPQLNAQPQAQTETENRAIPGAPPTSGNSRNGIIAAALAAVVGLYYIGSQPEPQQATPTPTPTHQQGETEAETPPTEPSPQTNDAPEPKVSAPEQVAETKPAAKPAVTPERRAPKVQPVTQRPPVGAVSSNVAYWYDPYGVVWELEFDGTEFGGIGRQNNVPVGSMLGVLDPSSNQVQYELYNAFDVPLGVGQGTLTDPTHIQFTTYDEFGLVIGQGTFHINHPPNS